MKTRTISSRKGRSAIQPTRPVTYVEPAIDREREASLLESATNEPC
jgi:hypothetical protein